MPWPARSRLIPLFALSAAIAFVTKANGSKGHYFNILRDSTTLLPEIAPCTIGQPEAEPQTFNCSKQFPEEGRMEGGYSAWMGQPVVLRVVAGNLRVPLRGRMLSETDDIVRLRIADSWDIDIFKSMVVCVEHDNPVYVVN